MSDRRHLKQRHEGWYFTMAVPRDLRSRFGKERIVKSLKTRDLTKAQEARWAKRAEYQELFRQARSGEPLTPSQIADYANEVYTAMLSQLDADARRGKYVDGPLEDDDARTPEMSALDLNADLISDAIEQADYRSVGLDIAVLEQRNGIEFQIDGATYTVLARAILEAKRAAIVGRSRALSGQPSEPYHAPGSVDTLTLQPRAPARRGLAFADVAARFIAERQRDAAFKLTNQTQGQYQAAYRLFDSWAQQPNIADIDRRKASDFLDAVAALDPHWGRRVGVKALSFAEIAERFGGQGRGLSNKTINRVAMALSMVWKHAEDRDGFDGKNPWTGQMRQTTKRRGSSEADKRAFTADEIAKLLQGERDTAPAEHTAATTLPWLTLIGAYSGMRLNEICELDLEDVKETAGILFFDLTSAKTEAGVRVVPIHSKILAAGFRDYLALSNPGPLWPGLKPGGPDKKRSWYISKRFTEYRRGLKLIDIDKVTGRDRIDFHSLRRSAITALKNAQIAEHDAAEVIGHEHPRVTFGVYPDRHQLARLQAIVEAIRY